MAVVELRYPSQMGSHHSRSMEGSGGRRQPAGAAEHAGAGVHAAATHYGSSPRQGPTKERQQLPFARNKMPPSFLRGNYGTSSKDKFLATQRYVPLGSLSQTVYMSPNNVAHNGHGRTDQKLNFLLLSESLKQGATRNTIKPSPLPKQVRILKPNDRYEDAAGGINTRMRNRIVAESADSGTRHS